MNNDIDKYLGEPKNPFKVPDGYFDTIASRVMENIPGNEVKLMPQHDKHDNGHAGNGMRRWRIYAAAASIVAAIFGAGLFINYNGTGADRHAAKGMAAVQTSNAENNVDAMADYIMADDYELYAYMAYE